MKIVCFIMLVCSMCLTFQLNIVRSNSLATSNQAEPQSNNLSSQISEIVKSPGEDSIQVNIVKAEISMERNILAVKAFSQGSASAGSPGGLSYIFVDQMNNKHEVELKLDYCYKKSKENPNIYEFDQKSKDKPKTGILSIEFGSEQDTEAFIKKGLENKGISQCSTNSK